MASEPIGVCRVCRRSRLLTFEHVPPESAFNSDAVPRVSAADYEAFKNGTFTPDIYDDGVGHHSLCGQCNQRTGAKYVEELTRGAKALMEVVQAVPAPIAPNELKFVAVELGPMRPLRYAKQMVTILLAINSEDFALENPELGDFVRLRDQTNLGPRYQLYLSAFSGYPGREVPVDAVSAFDLSSGRQYQVTEVAYPPFVYSMTVDDPRPPFPIGNVTDFSSYRYGQELRSLRMRLILDTGRNGVLPMAARRLSPEQVAEVESNLSLYPDAAI